MGENLIFIGQQDLHILLHVTFTCGRYIESLEIKPKMLQTVFNSLNYTVESLYKKWWSSY